MIPGLCSVIIPTYTYERLGWLRQAIASVEAQTLPRDRWELLVVRDADDPVCDREAPALPPGGQYLRGPRHGLSASINAAFARARGEFLTIVQDDDWILPRKLEASLLHFAARPVADVVFSLPLYYDADGITPETPARLRDWLLAHRTVSAADLRGGVPFLVHGTATVYRRSAWLRAGPWDESLRTAEEWAFHLQLLECGAIFCGFDEALTAYRQHPGQKTGTVKTRHGSYNKRRSAARIEALARIKARFADLLPGQQEAFA